MMYGSNPTIVGVFANTEEARKAIEGLKNAGFQAGDIGILMLDPGKTIDLARETGTEVPQGVSAIAPAADLFGWITGWMLGGWTLAIPGIGPLIAAGTIRTSMESAAVGSGLLAVTTTLEGFGIPREEADRYTEELVRGGILITVRSDRRYQEAHNVLRRHGARDRLAPSTGLGQSVSGSVPVSQTEGTVLELREERLRAHKEKVKTGEVEVRKEVVSERQSIDVPVTHEEVYVERQRVEPRRSERPIGEEETLRVSVHEEHASPEKETVVTEEVRLGKRQVTETERVSDVVYREEVRVEQQGDFEILGGEEKPSHEHRFSGNRCAICGATKRRKAA